MRLWNRKRFLALCLAAVLLASILPVRTEVARAEEPPGRMSESEWKKLPTGSAGVLEGRSVLISIFVNDKVSKWTKKAKKEANKKVRSASAYIRRQAKKYGKTVSLVADIEKYKDISYSFQVNQKVSDSIRSQDKLYRKIMKFVGKNIDVNGLRSRYKTDSIGFLFHLNKSGTSSTLVHYAEESTEFFYECATLFSKYGKQAEGASTYAHEILHLFGARDLYERSLADGITASLVRHIEKKFPKEIMYSTYDRKGRMLKYKITNQISRITAYFLGWKDSVPEVKKYALPKLKEKGCFYEWTSI